MSKGKATKATPKQPRMPKLKDIVHGHSDPVRAARVLSRALETQAARLEKAGFVVETLGEGEIQKNLRGLSSNSPSINQISYSMFAVRGSTLTFSVGVTNPDSWTWSSLDLWGQFFVGPANAVTDAGQALVLADSRFPRFGHAEDVPANTTKFWQITFQVPASIEVGVYGVNFFLFKQWPFGVGSVLSRTGFHFKAT